MFAVGDTVEITHAGRSAEARTRGGRSWIGYRATVESVRDTDHSHVWLTPIEPRPDGNRLNRFMWNVDALRKVDEMSLPTTVDGVEARINQLQGQIKELQAHRESLKPARPNARRGDLLIVVVEFNNDYGNTDQRLRVFVADSDGDWFTADGTNHDDYNEDSCSYRTWDEMVNVYPSIQRGKFKHITSDDAGVSWHWSN